MGNQTYRQKKRNSLDILVPGRPLLTEGTSRLPYTQGMVTISKMVLVNFPLSFWV